MSTAEDTAQHLLAILPLINRIMLAELRPEADDGMTMPQFRVLSYLAEGPLTLSDVARLRRVSLQAAGEMVQALVDRGWITRVPDAADRRQMQLHITDSGRQQGEHARRRMEVHLTPFMALLTPDESAAVQVALNALQRVLSGEEVSEVENDQR